MRIELAERLRCIRPHATTPLVVVASEVVGRDLVRGVAGCPVCRYEARFEEGDLRAAGGSILPHAATPAVLDLDRLVALLGLAEPGGTVLLAGRYSAAAPALAARAGVSVVTDVARPPRRPEDPVASLLGFEGALPFLDATFRAAAIAAPETAPETARTRALNETVRCLVISGRLLAPASTPLPAGVRELARDAAEWVAEREPTVQPVGLTRRS